MTYTVTTGSREGTKRVTTVCWVKLALFIASSRPMTVEVLSPSPHLPHPPQNPPLPPLIQHLAVPNLPFPPPSFPSCRALEGSDNSTLQLLTTPQTLTTEQPVYSKSCTSLSYGQIIRRLSTFNKHTFQA